MALPISWMRLITPGQLLVQAGPDEVVDLDQVEPAQQRVERVLDLVARLRRRTVPRSRGPPAGTRLRQNRTERGKSRVEDQEVGHRVARDRPAAASCGTARNAEQLFRIAIQWALSIGVPTCSGVGSRM